MNLESRITEYLSWADEAIWRFVRELSDDEFNRSLGDNGRSIRQRLLTAAGNLDNLGH